MKLHFGVIYLKNPVDDSLSVEVIVLKVINKTNSKLRIIYQESFSYHITHVLTVKVAVQHIKRFVAYSPAYNKVLGKMKLVVFSNKICTSVS